MADMHLDKSYGIFLIRRFLKCMVPIGMVFIIFLLFHLISAPFAEKLKGTLGKWDESIKTVLESSQIDLVLGIFYDRLQWKIAKGSENEWQKKMEPRIRSIAEPHLKELNDIRSVWEQKLNLILTRYIKATSNISNMRMSSFAWTGAQAPKAATTQENTVTIKAEFEAAVVAYRKEFTEKASTLPRFVRELPQAKWHEPQPLSAATSSPSFNFNSIKDLSSIKSPVARIDRTPAHLHPLVILIDTIVALPDSYLYTVRSLNIGHPLQIAIIVLATIIICFGLLAARLLLRRQKPKVQAFFTKSSIIVLLLSLVILGLITGTFIRVIVLCVGFVMAVIILESLNIPIVTGFILIILVVSVALIFTPLLVGITAWGILKVAEMLRPVLKEISALASLFGSGIPLTALAWKSIKFTLDIDPIDFMKKNLRRKILKYSEQIINTKGEQQ